MHPETMKCFYHSVDLDGWCSAAIVKHKYPYCELIPIDYGDIFPWDTINKNDVLYMVDFSLPIEDMQRLESMCDLVWIDHHKTALKAANKVAFNPKGLRELDMAGCELTWRYCYPGCNMPKGVYLLGRYDIWALSDPDVLPFQYGMRQLSNHPNDPASIFVWNDIFQDDENFIKNVIDCGYVILKYIEIDNEKRCKAMCYEFEFEGYKCVAANVGMVNSQFFDFIYDPQDYDVMITYYNKGGKYWHVSLYTTKKEINVGEICKKYGGGGHSGAAGFITKELPFSFFSERTI